MPASPLASVQVELDGGLDEVPLVSGDAVTSDKWMINFIYA